jgi:hypothetical protein
MLLRDLHSRWLHRPKREWVGEVAPRLVAGHASGSGWQTTAVDFTSTQVAVATVDRSDAAGRFIVKVPWTSGGADKLRRQAEVLRALEADPRLADIRDLIPRCVHQGTIDGRFFTIEEAVPGVPATTIMSRRDQRPKLLASAARSIGELHQRTAEQTVVDDAIVDAWAHQPLRLLEAYAGPHRRSGLLLDAIGRLHDELHDALLGRTIRTSWIHGDFWHGNLLTAEDAPDVTGIVDWDGADDDQLALHDMVHLHVFSRRLAHGDELGDIVVRALNGSLAETLGLPAEQVSNWLNGLPERSAVILYWLRHILLFMDTEGHHDNQRWLRTNVEFVLAGI